MRSKDALRKVVEVISRKRNAAAVVVPRKIAFVLAEEMYPESDTLIDIADAAMDRARSKYFDLVTKGGYIGTLLNMPMVVADDVVICSLSEQELHESAARLGVDLAELRRDYARAGVA